MVNIQCKKSEKMTICENECKKTGRINVGPQIQSEICKKFIPQDLGNEI